MIHTPYMAALILCWAFASESGLPPATNPPPAQAKPGQLAQSESDPAQPQSRQPKSYRHPGSPSPHRPWTSQEWEERRRELQGLPPEERRAKIREWRRERTAHWPEARGLTAEEARQKRLQMLQRLQEGLAELKRKKAEATLEPQEERRLRRLLELEKRFQVDAAPEEPTPEKPAGTAAPEKPTP